MPKYDRHHSIHYNALDAGVIAALRLIVAAIIDTPLVAHLGWTTRGRSNPPESIECESLPYMSYPSAYNELLVCESLGKKILPLTKFDYNYRATDCIVSVGNNADTPDEKKLIQIEERVARLVLPHKGLIYDLANRLSQGEVISSEEVMKLMDRRPDDVDEEIPPLTD